MKKNYLKLVVQAVEKSTKTDRPIDALKVIKPYLKELGFSVGAMDKENGHFAVEYTPPANKQTGKDWQPTTTAILLRDIRKAIAATDVKHNTLSSKTNELTKFVKKHGAILERKGLQSIVEKLDPSADIKQLRAAMIELKKSIRGDKNIYADAQKIRIESQAFYWVVACQNKLAPELAERKQETKEVSDNAKLYINPDFVIETATSALKSPDSNWKQLAIALVAVTGRRTTEVLKTATFAAKSKNELVFTGLLKRKNREIFGADNNAYDIPCLADPKLIVKGLKRLRKLMSNDTVTYKNERGEDVTARVLDEKFLHDTWHNQAVHKKYSRVLSAYAESMYASSAFRTYILRAAYTEIAYDMGLSKKGESRKKFRERALCHSDDKSQSNYDKFELSTDVDKFISEKADTAAAVDKKTVEVLKACVAAMADYPRAKLVLALFVHALDKAKAGELALSDIDATWARAQVVPKQSKAEGLGTECVKVGGAQVKQFMQIFDDVSK